MSKVSILMAAYNAAPYLKQSIESVKAQTLTDWQLLCVNDASTDSTLQILESYAATDNRIRVISLAQNGGIAKARNAALQLADGDYVCMLDSDDWLSPDSLQLACSELDSHPEADTVLFQVDEMFDDYVHRIEMPKFEVMTGEEAFEASLSWKIHGIYMIRTSLHKRFPYDDSLRFYSDENTTRIHYLRSRGVRQCGAVYHYRQHPTSATHRIDATRFDFLLANESMRRQMLAEGAPKSAVMAYEHLRWLKLIDLYMFYHINKALLSPDDRAYAMKVMKDTWKGIDTTLLPFSLKIKPGYMPLRPFWRLFKIQEELYFDIRFLLKGK